MGIQFYNINKTAKPDKNSRIKTSARPTLSVVKKNNLKKKQLTAKNLAFLRSLNAI